MSNGIVVSSSSAHTPRNSFDNPSYPPVRKSALLIYWRSTPHARHFFFFFSSIERSPHISFPSGKMFLFLLSKDDIYTFLSYDRWNI